MMLYFEKWPDSLCFILVIWHVSNISGDWAQAFVLPAGARPPVFAFKRVWAVLPNHIRPSNCQGMDLQSICQQTDDSSLSVQEDQLTEFGNAVMVLDQFHWGSQAGAKGFVRGTHSTLTEGFKNCGLNNKVIHNTITRIPVAVKLYWMLVTMLTNHDRSLIICLTYQVLFVL